MQKANMKMAISSNYPLGAEAFANKKLPPNK